MTSYIFREARGMYWHTLWDRLCPLCHLPFTLWGGRFVLKEDAPEVLQYWSKQRLLNPWDRVQFRSTSPTVQHSSWHGTIPKNQMEISSSKDYLIFQTLKIGEPKGFLICSSVPIHALLSVHLLSSLSVCSSHCLSALLTVCLLFSLFVCSSHCLSALLTVCLLFSLSVCSSHCLSALLTVNLLSSLSVCSSHCLSAFLTVCLLFSLFVCSSHCLSALLTVCLLFSLSVCSSHC